MNYTLISIVLILFCLFLSKKKEGFTNLIDKRRCASIFGENHPRCKIETDNIRHLGYFKINETKYPIMNFGNENDMSNRYLLKNNKFYRLKQEYWNKSFYFRNQFIYHQNVPLELISNYTYRGKINNTPFNKSYFIFGKKIFASNYKYVIFEEIKNKLEHKFTIEHRKKLEDGDPVFIRHNNATLGPFIFHKEN